MDFELCGMPIKDARNIEWESNGDGTGQLWFNSVVRDKSGEDKDYRFHIFRLRMDPLMAIEYVNGKLYEAVAIDEG